MCLLTAVGISATIRGAYQSCGINFSPAQIFILKRLSAVYAGDARAVVFLHITSLDHELVDDTVEGNFLVGQACMLSGA
jgi:hypothetical protein